MLKTEYHTIWIVLLVSWLWRIKGEGGLNNFLPLKRGGLFERGGLIEDLQYTKYSWLTWSNTQILRSQIWMVLVIHWPHILELLPKYLWLRDFGLCTFQALSHKATSLVFATSVPVISMTFLLSFLTCRCCLVETGSPTHKLNHHKLKHDTFSWMFTFAHFCPHLRIHP